MKIKQHLKALDMTAMFFAGIWLVFLLFLIAGIIQNDSLVFWQKGVSLSAVAIFCIIYLLSFGNHELLSAPTQWQRSVRWSLLLLVPTIVVAIIVGPIAIFFGTYFVAQWAFQNKPSVGMPIGIGIALFAVLMVVFLFPVEEKPNGFGFIAGAIFVLIAAFLSARAEQKNEEKLRRIEAEASQRFARDVHDLLGHSLTVINLKAEVAAAMVDTHPERARAELEEISGLSRTALAEVRATVTRVNSPTFAGEIEASKKALQTAGISYQMPSPQDIQAIGVNSALFTWVLRESITNVLRHSKATFCTVRFSPSRIEIEDDGRAANIVKGNGLKGLESRVLESGGDFRIETGSSTTIRVSMDGDFSSLKVHR